MIKNIKINGVNYSLFRGNHGESITDEDNHFTWSERNNSERSEFIKLRRFFDNII